MPDNTSKSAINSLNQLYYGDCLDVLRTLPAICVDLIYLDPPFNSKRDYNAFFKNPEGIESTAQIIAFEDTWHWGKQAEDEFCTLLKNPAGGRISEVITALRSFLKENDMMAYLVMMASRLVELHRVLKHTGSLYLHCDPTASHYLKIILDSIFDIKNFRNEIIWKRTSAHNSAKKWGTIHDTILFYTKTDYFIWNNVYTEYNSQYLKKSYNKTDETGRNYSYSDLTGSGVSNGESGQIWNGFNPSLYKRHWAIPNVLKEEFPEEMHKGLTTLQWLDLFKKNNLIYMREDEKGWPCVKRYFDRVKGVKIQDLISDISPLKAQSKEKLGYPTQKPLALLERIISASSNPGDVVLDPFCGCGTAIHAAQKLGRQWIGIDITHLAVALIKQRMHKAFPDVPFQVIGTPKDVESARFLAQTDGLHGRYQFQFWALSLIDALPLQDKKKGADGGIDGYIWAYASADSKAKPFKIIISVKSGKIPANHIRELKGLIQNSQDNTQMAVLLTLEEPSKQMLTEAVAAGVYTYPNGKQFPRMQILTIGDILANNKKVEFLDYGEQRGMNRQIQREPKQSQEQNLL